MTANDFHCNLYSHADLRVNSSDGWINVRSYGFYLYPPCEEMPGGWYEIRGIDHDGDWMDLNEGWNHMIHEEGVYDMRINATDLNRGSGLHDGGSRLCLRARDHARDRIR